MRHLHSDPVSSLWHLTGLMILIICVVNYWKQRNSSAKVSLLASCFCVCLVFSQGWINQGRAEAVLVMDFVKDNKRKLALKMDRKKWMLEAAYGGKTDQKTDQTLN